MTVAARLKSKPWLGAKSSGWSRIRCVSGRPRFIVNAAPMAARRVTSSSAHFPFRCWGDSNVKTALGTYPLVLIPESRWRISP